jgi:hypothetical protein
MQNKMQNKNQRREIQQTLNEGFDGIKKDNSRIIFGILLALIIIDFIYDYFS